MCKIKDYEEKYSGYIELLKQTLSKKRFTHSMNVAEMCYELAVKHGEDTEKAYLAGLLHDIKKEETPNAQKSLAVLSGMDVSAEELETPALWHGPAAAYHLKTKLDITDEDILLSVRYHTAGNADMSRLQKIVYLGDLVSADRSYKDVEKYRKYSFDDLDGGMYHALKYSVGDTLSKGGLVPPCTINAYNFYTRIYNTKIKEKQK